MSSANLSGVNDWVLRVNSLLSLTSTKKYSFLQPTIIDWPHHINVRGASSFVLIPGNCRNSLSFQTYKFNCFLTATQRRTPFLPDSLPRVPTARTCDEIYIWPTRLFDLNFVSAVRGRIVFSPSRLKQNNWRLWCTADRSRHTAPFPREPRITGANSLLCRLAT